MKTSLAIRNSISILGCKLDRFRTDMAIWAQRDMENGYFRIRPTSTLRPLGFTSLNPIDSAYSHQISKCL